MENKEGKKVEVTFKDGHKIRIDVKKMKRAIAIGLVSVIALVSSAGIYNYIKNENEQAKTNKMIEEEIEKNKERDKKVEEEYGEHVVYKENPEEAEIQKEQREAQINTWEEEVVDKPYQP